MRPLFTVHAGEFLVGEHIERTFPNLNVLVAAKDTGVDLLVTDVGARTAVSFAKSALSASALGFLPPPLCETLVRRLRYLQLVTNTV